MKAKEEGQPNGQDPPKEGRREFIRMAAAGAGVTIAAALASQDAHAQDDAKSGDRESPRRNDERGGNEVRIKGGFIAPSPRLARQALDQLQSDLRSDKCLQDSYLKDPRQVLGARGLGVDIQNEVLAGAGFPKQFIMGCEYTCAITNCGQTIVVSK